MIYRVEIKETAQEDLYIGRGFRLYSTLFGQCEGLKEREDK